MADANDEPSDIDDIDLTTTPIGPASASSETTEEPVQPTDETTTQTNETTDDGTTPSTTGETTEETPASETKEETPTDQSQRQYQAWIERQRLKNDVAREVDENYAAPTQEQLIENGMSEQEAKVQAAIEQLNFERERTRVADLTANLRDEAFLVQQEMGIYNPSSPDYDKDFAEKVGQLYEQAAKVQRDGNVVLNADFPLYDYFKQMADFRNAGYTKGLNQNQQNQQEMQARVETPGGSSSTRPASNSTEDLYDRIKDIELT